MFDNKNILATCRITSFGHALITQTLKKLNVKKILSIKVTDLVSAITHVVEQIKIRIRPDDKLHKKMINLDDAVSTYEDPDYFKKLPNINGWDKDEVEIKDGKKVPADFNYNSATNKSWMSSESLTNWLHSNRSKWL